MQLPPNHRSSSRTVSGFTLIEMIGVLTVVMILATLIFSVTIRQLDAWEARKEDALLARFALSLERSIQRHRAIPSLTNWAQVIATEAGMDTTAVSVNPRKNTRILWIDADLRIGNNSSSLPYQQSSNGSVVTNASGVVVPPINPRLILISSLGPPFPSAVVTGGTVATNFNALWDAPPETLPTVGPWGAWGGIGRDLRVQRIQLAPLFVRVTLHNHASPAPGRYSVDGLGTNTVPDGSGVNAFFIKGTVLDLLTHTNTLDARQVLARDCSYVYNLGVWRGSLFHPPPVTPRAGVPGRALLPQSTQFERRRHTAGHTSTGTGCLGRLYGCLRLLGIFGYLAQGL